VLINITGGLDMTLHEVDEAANRIREEVDPDANIIFGSTFDATMQGRMRVSVVATGIAALAAQQPAPNYLSLDMNRPVQTGQPALSRAVAPPVGRVAMPAAAAAAATAPAAAAPVAPPPAPPMVAPPPMPAMAQPAPAPIAAAAPPAPAPVAPPVMVMAPPPMVEAPAAYVAAPVAPAPVEIAPEPPQYAPPAPPPIAAAAPAAVAPPQRPLVDENDWRVSRPPLKPAVRASEAVTRPVAARPASESRAPNLFQRITGAFASPKMPAPVAQPAPEPAPRAAENVVPVAAKSAARPAPVQTSISLDVTERSKPARDDDDLQIPAFLRRQAN
jgi:cell division protein FtsZ